MTKAKSTLEAFSLTAGRELDALVAEKVMGVPRREIRIKGETNTHPVWTESRWFQDGQQDRYQMEAFGGPKPYSTDVAAAWALAQHFDSFYLLKVADRYTCRISDFDMTWSRAHTSETAPLAICLAALKAVSVLSHTEEGK